MKNTVHQLVVVRAIVIKSEVVRLLVAMCLLCAYQLHCMPASFYNHWTRLVGWTGGLTFSILKTTCALQ